MGLMYGFRAPPITQIRSHSLPPSLPAPPPLKFKRTACNKFPAQARAFTRQPLIGADFWEGDVTKHFSGGKKGFSVKRDEGLCSGGKMGFSVKRDEGLGKDFYRRGNSVKRSGLFSEPPDSGN